ncbi:hypothetical protein M0802_011728 [Mischocyttarus mexicanus]|nr:hypothetical protein M0802_011728 [Mischocyttarus mexicanus]
MDKTLSSDKRNKLNETRNFICDKCSAGFKKKGSLMWHLQSICGSELRYLCPYYTNNDDDKQQPDEEESSTNTEKIDWNLDNDKTNSTTTSATTNQLEQAIGSGQDITCTHLRIFVQPGIEITDTIYYDLRTPSPPPALDQSYNEISLTAISITPFSNHEDAIDLSNTKSSFVCPYCKESFDVYNDLSVHIYYFCLNNPFSKHYANKRLLYFECSNCNSHFKTESQFNHHLREICNVLWKCDKCQNYVKYEWIDVNNIRETCKESTEKLTTPLFDVIAKTLKTETINSEDTIFEDDVDDDNWLETRRRPLEITCHLCKKLYKRPQDLGKHLKYYCTKNPKSKCYKKNDILYYECKVCYRRFSKRKLLTFHKRHECQTFYQCPFCKSLLSGRLSKKHLNSCRIKHSEMGMKERCKLNDSEENYNIVDSDTDRNVNCNSFSHSESDTD